MSFIVSLLARWGLTTLAPRALLWITLSAIFAGGLGATWYAGWVDIPALLLITCILALVAGIFTLQSRGLQFIALGVIIICTFALGRYEEGKGVKERITTAVTEAVERVHADYKRRLDEDEARRKLEAEQARQRAEIERRAWQQALEDLNKQIEELYEAAAKDKNANRPAFGVDSVERMNKLRGNELLKE